MCNMVTSTALSALAIPPSLGCARLQSRWKNGTVPSRMCPAGCAQPDVPSRMCPVGLAGSFGLCFVLRQIPSELVVEQRLHGCAGEFRGWEPRTRVLQDELTAQPRSRGRSVGGLMLRQPQGYRGVSLSVTRGSWVVLASSGAVPGVAEPR